MSSASSVSLRPRVPGKGQELVYQVHFISASLVQSSPFPRSTKLWKKGSLIFPVICTAVPGFLLQSFTFMHCNNNIMPQADVRDKNPCFKVTSVRRDSCLLRFFFSGFLLFSSDNRQNWILFKAGQGFLFFMEMEQKIFVWGIEDTACLDFIFLRRKCLFMLISMLAFSSFCYLCVSNVVNLLRQVELTLYLYTAAHSGILTPPWLWVVVIYKIFQLKQQKEVQAITMQLFSYGACSWCISMGRRYLFLYK